MNTNENAPTLMVVEIVLGCEMDRVVVLDDLEHHRAVLSVKVISE